MTFLPFHNPSVLYYPHKVYRYTGIVASHAYKMQFPPLANTRQARRKGLVSRVLSNPPNGSPDNGLIRLLIQVLASPISVLKKSKTCWLMVQSAYWFNIWLVPMRNH